MFADVPRLTSIYVIRMEDFAYKIGVGRVPRTRRSELQVGSPFRLTLLGSALIPEKVAEAVEDSLHKRHHATRINGEWFSLPENRTEKWFVQDVLECASLLARCKETSNRFHGRQ